jgi:DtxR family Mn-dependent transcriptional regulator
MATYYADDYLKNLYKLQRKGQKVTTSSLAESMEVSPPSVTDMMKKLSERGLVNHTPYHGVLLTNDGEREALRILRRHRLWEVFLVEFLNYSWDKVHDDACKLEHATSPELEEKLDAALGYPKVDPHGDPIPTKEGKVVEPDYICLADMQPGQSGTIARVNDLSKELLQYVTKLGLSLDSKILVKDRIEFDGTVVVKVGKDDHSISRKVARNVFVSLTS